MSSGVFFPPGGGGGGGGSSSSLVDSEELGAAAATITFDITSYTEDEILLVAGIQAATAGPRQLQLILNNDTNTANYFRQHVERVSAAAATASITNGYNLGEVAATSLTNWYSALRVMIVGLQSGRRPIMFGQLVGPGTNGRMLNTFQIPWGNTAQVTEIKVQLDTGNMVSGSYAKLFRP